ncbi:MAG: hypothetical protein GF310_11915, partial [candidate division Zixibacteria bacterium]|nr:hypothetical protein [candidate division Zixibacteria bacterium]
MKRIRLYFLILFITVSANAVLFAQESETDSASSVEDSIKTDSTSNSLYEIDLKIEELTGTNKIGQFFHKMRYRLDYNLDSIPEEEIDEYVTDMRARRSVKSTIYGIYKPIPMREWPW